MTPPAPKIPDAVTIGPHTYEIRTDPEAHRLLREDGSNGDSRPDRLVVQLDLDRPHTAIADTFIHELLHCAWQQTALRVEHDTDAEERAVTALAPLVLGMLRANPELVKYLTA